jgi:sialic acid synthase SpsE
MKSITKKPVIISMGMGGDRKKISKIFQKNKKIFCYCISEYPTKLNKIKWIDAIKYNGFSDHTLGITAPIIFATLKNKQKVKNIFIEKHVKLKNSNGPDASSSIDTNELRDMIYHLRNIEKLNL